VDLDLDLGKETVQGLGGGDAALEGSALSKRNDVLRGILEANPVGGTMRAQQFHGSRCQISSKAANINLSPSSWGHLQLLNEFGG
jgi:hypothetical protein